MKCKLELKKIDLNFNKRDGGALVRFEFDSKEKIELFEHKLQVIKDGKLKVSIV